MPPPSLSSSVSLSSLEFTSYACNCNVVSVATLSDSSFRAVLPENIGYMRIDVGPVTSAPHLDPANQLAIM